MNKKKLLASTMTSVMAISSAATSLVSMAALDATFDDEAATRGDLQALLASDRIVELRDGKVDEYGSKSGANFLKAIEFAENLLSSSENAGTTGTSSNLKIRPEDYTAAYQMVKAAEAKLVQHDKIELQALLAKWFTEYDSNNMLNDHGDFWFYPNTPTNAWDEFESAYDNADAVRDSDDLLETTDAYEELEDAASRLKAKPTVTKERATAARQAYEDIQKKEFNWQPWQRGEVSLKGDKYDGQSFAWGILYSHIMSANASLVAEIDNFTQIKNYNITSDDDIVAAVETMERAVKIINGFSATLDSGSESKIKKLLATYHGQLVYTYNPDYAAAVVDDMIAKCAVSGTGTADTQFLVSLGVYRNGDNITGADSPVAITTASTNKNEYWNEVTTDNKTISADLTVRIKTTAVNDLYYILDNDYVLSNGKNAFYYTGTIGTDAEFFYTDRDAAKAVAAERGIPESYIKTLRKGATTGTVLSDHIPVGADEVVAAKGLSVTVTDTTALAACLTTINAKLVDVESAMTAACTTASTWNLAANANGALSTVVARAEELYTAIDNLSTHAAGQASTITKAGLNDVQDDYDDVVAAYKAYTNAVNALPATANSFAITKATLIDTLKAKMDLLTPLFDSKDTAGFPVLHGAYNAEWTQAAVTAVYSNAAMNTALNTTSQPGNNKTVMDKAGESIPNSISFKPNNGSNVFTNAGYNSSRKDPKSSRTVTSVEAALIMYDGFKGKNWGTVLELDNKVSFAVGKEMTGSTVQSEAWKLLYNYMNYAIHDAFDASANKKYKLTDVEALIEKAKTLDNDTDEVSLFSVSHDAMVKDRTGAIQWVKLGKADDNKNANPRYADYISKYDVVTRVASASYESNEMYDMLNDSYAQLNKEYSAFKYSFGDIIAKMDEIAKRVDKKEFSEAATAKIKTALTETANAMLKLGSEELYTIGGDILEDTALFNGDGTINRNNRLFTYGKDFDGLATEYDAEGVASTITVADNTFHNALNSEYAALTKAYEAAIKELEKPKDETTMDVNGDNDVNVLDAVALFNVVLTGGAYNAKYDYDKNNAIDVKDVEAIVAKVLG